MSAGSEDSSSESGNGASAEPVNGTGNERREALIKLGRYAAYATPIVIASVSAAYGGPMSGAPTPAPSPAPAGPPP